MVNMGRTLMVVYEKGVLRPLEPLDLLENQRIAVTLQEPSNDPLDQWIDREYHVELPSSEMPVPSHDQVRRELSTISGSLSEAIRRDRDLRG